MLRHTVDADLKLIPISGLSAGVGFTREPPIFLKAGDTVRIEIERVGTLENPVVAFEGDATAVADRTEKEAVR